MSAVRSLVSTTAAFALVVAGLLQAPAAQANSAEVELHHVTESTGFRPSVDVLPVLDTAVGLGEALRADEEKRVEIPAPGGAGALVRISLSGASTDGTLTVDGLPALHVGAGRVASSTVLTKVDDGGMLFRADVAADLRVDVLAVFAGDPETPGATVALAEPIRRLDVAASADDERVVGLVGAGGVPSTGVSAAYVSLDVTVPAARLLRIGGQEVAVPAGRTVFTTLLTPDATGSTTLAGIAGATITGDIVGYVRSALTGWDASAVDGSFVPTSATAIDLDVSDAAPTPVRLPGAIDSGYTLALVTGASASVSTQLEFGAPYAGHGRGAYVDAGIGTPHLALVPVDDQRAQASLRRGTGSARILALGSFIDATADSVAQSPATAVIESPADGTDVDLTQVSTFTLTGTFVSDASIRSATVSVDGAVVGSPSIDASTGSASFSFETAVPRSGEYTFTVAAVDGAGRHVEASSTVRVTLPDQEEVVVAENAVVVDASADLVLGVTENEVLLRQQPGFAPGDVIVGGVGPHAPEGFLRRVVAIDQVGDSWRVTTSPAAITDVVHQGEIDQDTELYELGAPNVDRNVSAGPDDTAGVVVHDEGVEDITYEQHEARLAPPAESRSLRSSPEQPSDPTAPKVADPDAEFPVFSAPEVRDAGRSESRLADGLARASIGLDETLRASHEFKGSFALSPGGAEDNSRATDSTKEEARHKLEATGGAVIEGSVIVGLSLSFVLKIDIDWGFFVPDVSVSEFSTVLSRSAETKLTAEAFLEAEYSYSRTLAKVQFAPVTFLIGPVPVVITTEMKVSLQASISAKVSVGVEWSSRVVQDYGFRYTRDGGWRSVDNTPRLSNTPPDIDAIDDALSGEIEAAFGPTFELSASIYDAAGPAIFAGARVGLQLEVGSDAIEFTVFAAAKIGVKVELKVPIIDHVILEQTVAQTRELRFTLLKWSLGYDEAIEGGGESGGSDPVNDPNMPRPHPAPDFDESDLRITLYWNKKSDLDLHLQEPDGTHIFYGNRGPTASRGTLDIDSNASCTVTEPDQPGGVENVYWPDEVDAPAGLYSVTVNQWSGCGLGDYATWVLEVWSGDSLLMKQSGNANATFSFRR